MAGGRWAYPVPVMETAGEGGPWGMALLAAYRKDRQGEETLPDFLENHVFAGAAGEQVSPSLEDQEGFGRYIARYKQALAVEKAAGEALR